MASVVKTTAVALRRGNTEANKIFTGVQGELVVDMGADGQGTDVNTTLRLHNGITTGGIPMARADLANTTTKVLATGRSALNDKNLAYADLSNIETSANPSNIISTFSSYGFVKGTEVETMLSSYVKTDFTNADTTKLATSAGHTGKNLAYADTTNINTKDLTDVTKHAGGASGDKALAYADMSNVDLGSITGRFASVDLSNVTTASWELIKTQQNIESQTFKDTTIVAGSVIAGHYPTTQAVVDYVQSGGGASDKLNTNFSNATDWTPLYSDSVAYFKYLNEGQIIAGGTGFEENNTYYTGITLDSDNETIKVEVTSVNSSGNISSAKINPEFGKTDLTSTNTVNISNEDGGKAVITFTSTLFSNGLYRYQVSSITTIVSGGFEELEYNNEDGVTAIPGLFIKALTVNDSGAITSYRFKPEEGSTDISGELTISSGITGATSARINAECLNTFPTIGGAGLLKTNLSNLPGMSNDDILAERNSDWRIRSNIAIPQTASAADYHRIVTAGLVSDALHNVTADKANKDGDGNVIKTTYAKIAGNNSFTGTNSFTTQPATDSSTKAATTAFVHSVLESIWGVGSLYFGTQATCPMTALIPGSTWTKIEGRYLLSSGTLDGTSETYSATNTVDAGLPDHKHYLSNGTRSSGEQPSEGTLGNSNNNSGNNDYTLQGFSNTSTYPADKYLSSSANATNSTYGLSETVRPAAYVINVWRRTA